MKSPADRFKNKWDMTEEKKKSVNLKIEQFKLYSKMQRDRTWETWTVHHWPGGWDREIRYMCQRRGKGDTKIDLNKKTEIFTNMMRTINKSRNQKKAISRKNITKTHQDTKEE